MAQVSGGGSAPRVENRDRDGKVWVPGHGLIDVPVLMAQNLDSEARARALAARLADARDELEKTKALVGHLQDRIGSMAQERERSRQQLKTVAKSNSMLIDENRELRDKYAAVLGLDDLDSWVARPPLPCPPQLADTLRAVIREYWSAKDKHGEMTLDGPGMTDLLRLAALMEEVGEASELFTYDKDAVAQEGGVLVKGQRVPWAHALMKELIQVANVAVTWDSYLRHPGTAVMGREAAEPTCEPTCTATWHDHTSSSCAGPMDELVAMAPVSPANAELWAPVRGKVTLLGAAEGEAELDAAGQFTVTMPGGATILGRVVSRTGDE